MKVVVPFTSLHPETYRALQAQADRHEIEYVYVGDDDYAYGRLLRRVWREGRTFMVVEHDIEVHPWTLDELEACSSPYCSCPYPWTTCVGPAMGATKFSSDFTATYPDALEIACRIPSNYGDGRGGHWKQLDVFLQAAVLRDFYNEQPCCHLPPVRHLNEGQRLLDIHRGKPVVTSVQGRTYLPPGLVASIAADVLADSREHGT